MARTLSLSYPLKAVAATLVTGVSLGLSSIFWPNSVLPIVLGISIVLTILCKPRFGYYLVLIVSPLHFISLSVSGPTAGIESLFLAYNFVVAIVFIGWVSYVAAKMGVPYTGSTLDFPILCLLFWSTFSLAWTHDLFHGVFETVALYTCYLGFVLSVALITRRRFLSGAICLWVIMGFVVAVGVIVSNWYHDSHSVTLFRSTWLNLAYKMHFFYVGGRSGGLAYCNIAANLLGLYALMSLGILLQLRGLRKIGFSILILLMITAIMMTGSRAGIGAIFLGLVSFALIDRDLRGKFIWSLMVIVLAMSVCYCSSQLIQGKEIAESRLRRVDYLADKEATLSSRLACWKVGFEKLFKTYGMGVGFGGFGKYAPIRYAHSTYFAMLFDLGFIGLLIFLWLIVSILRAAYLSMRRCTDQFYRRLLQGFIAGLILLGIHGTVDVVIHPTTWLFIGLGTAIVNLSKPGNTGET